MSEKRNRSTNWDEEEKQLFRSVLKNYSNIIENKSLDTNTNKSKVKAWEQVHKKFNQLNSRPRDLNRLKIQWKSMKVQARKTYGSFQREINKTGGGARPATPSDAVMEVKDLLNPLELIRDHNIYDSDGIVVELQNSLDDTVINMESGSASNINLETIKNVDDQAAIQEYNPLLISQEDAVLNSPEENDNNSFLLKLSDDDTTMVTPKIKPTVSGKKVAKRKTVMNSALKPKMDKEDYVTKMLSHSTRLKDEEHMRRMEMAEEEHAIKMQLHNANIKNVLLQRDKERRDMEMAEEEHAIKMQIHRKILKKNIV